MMLLSFLAVNYTTALGGRCPFVAISTLPPFDVLFTMPQVASLRSLLPPRELRLANGEVRARLYTHLTCWRATDANGHVLLTAGNAQSYLSMVRRNMRLCKQMQPSMELRDREDRPCGEFLWRSEESAADIRCPAECIDVALAMAIIVRETYLQV